MSVTSLDPLRAVYQLPDRHLLIAMEMAEHPGAIGYEILRLIPGREPRWIYERWTLRRFKGLDTLDHHKAAPIRKQAELVWGLVGGRYRGVGHSQRVILVPPPTRDFPACRFCGARLTEHERDGYLYVLTCTCGARLRYIYRTHPPLVGWGSLNVERFPDDHRLGRMGFEQRLAHLHREWDGEHAPKFEPATYTQLALL